ncbi:glucosaminidase domain-containing protein [uncultured Acinetobacter sp.]|uniref:glucosaminidase domain-containing protein n=1 Tax=uncultured Acinetobacter sp. TaxID=165433 RepID=UPI003748E5A6
MADPNVIRNFFVALGFTTDQSKAEEMKKALVSVEEKAKILNKALLGLAVGSAYAVTKVANELDKLYFSSQRIGASATNINAFGNAITQMGGNAESAIGTLESLAEKMRNSPGYEGMLNGLGVSTKEANGDMRDRVEVMKDLSGVLSQMPAYQANAYAQSLGIDQNTLLAMRDGKFLQNMEKYQKIQKELGMNDDLTKSGNEFMTEYRDLTMMTKTGFQVLVMQAGKALIPILKLLNFMIREGIHAFSQLHPAIKSTLSVGLQLGMFALVLKGLVTSFGMLKTGLSVIRMFVPALKAFRLAFLATPLGWITALIVGLAAAIGLLYDDFKTWKEGGKSFIDWSKWIGGFDKIMNKIRDFIELLESIKDKVVNFVQKIVSDPVSAVKEVVDTAKDALTDINNGPTSKPVKAINEVSKNIVDTAKGAIQKAKEVVVGGAKIINDEVKTTVKNSVNNSINSVGSYSSVAPIKSGAKGKKQIDFIKKYWSAAVKISQALNTKPEFLLAQFAGETDWGKKIIEGTGFNLGNIKASKNWKGGTVKAWDKIEKSYDPYKVYATAEEFADDYIKLVGNSKRYKSVKGAQDEKTFFSELKKSGYATDKEYVSKNLAMVKSVNNRLDQNQTLKTSKTTNNLPLDSIGLANFAQNAYVPTGNPNKDQVNKLSTNSSSSQVTINQNYQTDMIINGARDPVESAKAVKRQQENSMVIMARGAQGALP